jgi:hypothetical protein
VVTRLVTEEELDALYAESTASGTFLPEPPALLVVEDGVEDDVDAEDYAVGPEQWLPAPVHVPEGPSPWERQHAETSRSYHAFCHFRDLKIRSASVAYRAHKRDCDKAPVPDHTVAPHHWRVWSSQWDWVERAALWDAEIDRQHREKVIQAQLEARERHARLAQAILTVLTVPVKAALEAARDPALVQKMIDAAGQGPAGSYQLLSTIARMAAVMPSVVTMERLALGMTTDSVEVEDKREYDASFANRIAADPLATDLAIALLARIARAPGAETVQ